MITEEFSNMTIEEPFAPSVVQASSFVRHTGNTAQKFGITALQ